MVTTWSLHSFCEKWKETCGGRSREVGWTLGKAGAWNGMLAVSPMSQVSSPAVYNLGPHIVPPEFIFFSGKSLHVLNMC